MLEAIDSMRTGDVARGARRSAASGADAQRDRDGGRWWLRHWRCRRRCARQDDPPASARVRRRRGRWTGRRGRQLGEAEDRREARATLAPRRRAGGVAGARACAGRPEAACARRVRRDTDCPDRARRCSRARSHASSTSPAGLPRRSAARTGLPKPGDPEVAMGDLLFAVVALARRLRVNPEEALRGRAMASPPVSERSRLRPREDGVDLHDLDDAALARALGGNRGLTRLGRVPCQIRPWAASYADTRRHIAPFVSLGAGKRNAPSVPLHVRRIDSPITLRRIAVVLIAGICGLVAFAVYGQVAQTRHLDAQVTALAAQNSALDAADLGSRARDRRCADRRLARGGGATARLRLPRREALRHRPAGCAPLGRRAACRCRSRHSKSPTPIPSPTPKPSAVPDRAPARVQADSPTPTPTPTPTPH